MKKSTRRFKKKVTNTLNSVQDAKGQSKETNLAWTPLQLEQAELAKQLEDYIHEFKHKLQLLNFKPTDKELVTLFVMNLHPRFKRLVEPLMPKYATWEEAAEFSKLHCTRISVILGSERHDSDEIFTSPESKALISSGYFISTASPSKNLYPGTEAIKHLLTAPSEPTPAFTSKAKFSFSVEEAAEEQEAPKEEPIEEKIEKVKESPTVAMKRPVHNGEPSTIKNHVANEDLQPVNTKNPDQTGDKATTKENGPDEITFVDDNNVTVSETTDNAVLDTPTNKEKSIDVQDTNQNFDIDAQEEAMGKPDEALKQDTKEEDPLKKDGDQAKIDADTILNKKTDELPKEEKKDTPSLMTKSAVQARIQQAVKNKKEREKKVSIPIIDSNSITSKSICNRVPDEHAGVNLAFLELEINGKKVKGLLAKLRWGSSAISFNCVKRLGLDIKKSDNFCIQTDFGFEDTIGYLTLPIIHPADAEIKAELDVQVLPMIYGGKVDLVLGADFFYYFNPTLNIKSRAIRFLEKETPYIVSKIE